MSKENHPNIQAVAVAVDIVESIRKNLRGDAANEELSVMTLIDKDIVDFITNISIKLDEKFGVE